MRTTVDGVEVGYDIYGAEASPQTLVLLHAFPLSRGQWREQATILSQHGDIRVVTPDLLGMGESSMPDGPATVERMAQLVLGLLESIGISQFVLGGLSMGGYVALAAWRANPRPIRGLILADTRATADTPEGRAGREATAQLALERGPITVFERDLPRLFSQLTVHTRPDIVEYARTLAGANSAQGIAAAARGLALRPDATSQLPTISCRTLVLVGEEDVITSVGDARVLFARIPNARLEVIADAGHLSNLDQPDRFSILVGDFLRGRSPGQVTRHEA
jgi:pimeloyl-ACP methyl ester carboxylesterase